MPLEGFTCPPGHVDPPPGQQNPIDFCLSKCPSPCASVPLLAAIWQAEHENHHKGAYISASMLSGTGCARQVWYERRGAAYYDVAQRRYWSFRGTHAHSIIERAAPLIAPLGWLQELRMDVRLTYDEPAYVFDAEGNWTGALDPSRRLEIDVGGTTDAYNPLRQELWDMKSMADAKSEMMITGSKPGTFSRSLEDRWVFQTNIYRWMMTRTPIADEVKRAFPELRDLEFYPEPTTLGIQGIAMMSMPRTGATYLHRKGYNETLYDIDAVPVLPLEEVEQHVRSSARMWYDWLVAGIQPPVVAAADKWLCRNCPFNGERIPGERCHPDAERRGDMIELALD